MYEPPFLILPVTDATIPKFDLKEKLENKGLNWKTTNSEFYSLIYQTVKSSTFDKGGMIVDNVENLKIEVITGFGSRFFIPGPEANPHETLKESLQKFFLKNEKTINQYNWIEHIIVRIDYHPEPCAKLSQIHGLLKKQCEQEISLFSRIYSTHGSGVHVLTALSELIDLLRRHYHPDKSGKGITELDISEYTNALEKWAYGNDKAVFKAVKNFPETGTIPVLHTYSNSTKKIIQEALEYIKTINPVYKISAKKPDEWEKISNNPECLIM